MAKWDQSQRMAKKSSFAALKSSLGNQLGTTAVVEQGVPEQDDNYAPYSPFASTAASDAADAETAFLDQLQRREHNDATVKKPRGPIRSRAPTRSTRSGMDVYRAKTIPAAVSSKGTSEEQYEAVIQELQGPVKAKISQMIEELGNTKKPAKQIEMSDKTPVETPVQTKFQKMFDEVICSRYLDNSDSIENPPKDTTPTRGLIVRYPGKFEPLEMARNERRPSPSIVADNPSSDVTHASDEQLQSRPKISNLLDELKSDRSDIVRAVEELSQKDEPLIRRVGSDSVEKPPKDMIADRVSRLRYCKLESITSDAAMGLAGTQRKLVPPRITHRPLSNVKKHSGYESRSQLSTLSDGLSNERGDIVSWASEQSQTGEPENSSPAEPSASLARSEQIQSSGPLFWRGRSDNPNRSNSRSMSTASQVATASVDAAGSKSLLPPEMRVIPSPKTRKPGRPRKTDPKQPPSDEASKVLGILHPKSKQIKSSRAPKSESKAKKGSGPKSKDKKNDVDSRQPNSKKRGSSRRERVREQHTMRKSKATIVRKHIAPVSVRKIRSLSLRKHAAGSGGRARAAVVALVGRRRNSVRRTSSTKPTGMTEGSREVRRTSLPLNQSNEQPPEVMSIEATELRITPLEISQPSVPGLQYGLDRVLFNSGVFQLQDPHSRVYNFDPYLQKIMPVVEFDYNALKQYKTSSQDTALSNLAKEHGKRYIGSTSSMTGTLGHFHYLISGFRPLNVRMLSRSFPDSMDSFTQINRAPNAIFLRKKDDGVFAIDVDKEYDGANVLMMLGKSMEKLLTLPKTDYERYRKENSHSVTEEERTAPEAYEYTTMGDFLMRSQLDAYDSRLPGTGTFDLKTRAVVSVRMDAGNYEPMTGYEIKTLQGRFQSYEREYYDMMRSTMLKYMLQVRMGRMDGIFLAYHNVERIFGFQYIPLPEIDRAIHSQSDPCLGDQEFKVSLELLNKALNAATAKFPDQSLRLHFETTQEGINGGSNTAMWIYAEPMAEDEIDRIQATSHAKTAEFERTMMGIEQEADDVTTVDGDFSVPEAVAESDQSEETPMEKPVEELAILSDSDPNLSGETETSSSQGKDSEVTSASHANSNFVSKLEETHPARELAPLFVASIICESQVNGSSVLRPENLKPEHKWEIKYYFQEWDTSEAMWARYEDMKSRRKGIFEQYRKEKEEEAVDGSEEGGGQKKRDRYIEVLQSMSREGRAFRERLDELDAGKEKVVVGQPLYTATEGIKENIEELDDYLGWLYRSNAHDTPEA